MNNTVLFSIEDMCNELNCKLNKCENRINNKLCDILQYLKDHRFYETNTDFNEIWSKPISCKACNKLFLNITFYEHPSGFALILLEEYNKIRDYVIKHKLNILPELLLLLSYLKLNISKDKSKPHCCWRYLSTIHQEIGLSLSSINKCLLILDELKIIYTYGRDTEVINSSIDDKKIFIRQPKIFTNYYNYIYSNNEYIIDTSYNYIDEVNKQISILDKNKNKEES